MTWKPKILDGFVKSIYQFFRLFTHTYGFGSDNAKARQWGGFALLPHPVQKLHKKCTYCSERGEVRNLLQPVNFSDLKNSKTTSLCLTRS